MSTSFPRRAQERAFLQSVIYAALFDYPLTLPQLREALIGERADEEELLRWYETSVCLQATVEYSEGYFFPRGRRDLLATRRSRETISRELLRSLATPLAFVARMPFVRMVALSGSLAHLNGDNGADVDLFVVTAPHRVWLVTVTTLALARLLGWRKRLCLNYVISERALWVAPADLFSANQIVHLQPLAGDDAYRRFLQANRFVERFYPNFEARRVPVGIEGRAARLAAQVERLLDWTIAPALERACRLLYGLHLRRGAHLWRSRDQVRLEPECLKLHTASHRRDVMERFECALEDAYAQAEEYGLIPEAASAQRASR